MTVFSARDIDLFYGKRQSLFGVSIPELEPGDVLGLIGANAAGKSTLLKALAGQLSCQGEVLFDQASSTQFSRTKWAQEVAYMPQTPPQESALLPYELLLSAAKSLSLPLSKQSLEQRIEELILHLGLEEFAFRPLYALSGGKRQLVGLALALIRNPKVMLLDEPTSALDIHWKMVVLQLVKNRVLQNGSVAVAALHDMDLAARYCTKLVMLQQGKVVALGSVKDVLTPENIAECFKVSARVKENENGWLQVYVDEPII